MTLTNLEEVEALAIQLTACANSIHDRLMIGIKNKDVNQYEAQLILHDATRLRQHANCLYLDAANCVVDGLPESENDILDVIISATDNIKTIKTTANFINIIADLLALASAAYAAKPGPIIASIKEVRDDVVALNNGEW